MCVVGIVVGWSFYHAIVCMRMPKLSIELRYLDTSLNTVSHLPKMRRSSTFWAALAHCRGGGPKIRLSGWVCIIGCYIGIYTLHI